MPRAVSFVLSIVALAVFGGVSLALGQDANWDLRNYHLYNPWALLDGRLAVDLAPAGMPTYFNPLLDLPYALLLQVVSPRLLAFAMGAWHGVSLLLLYAVGRAVLPADRDRPKVAVFAVVGCLGAAFLSELGNTMGDDTTAPFLLGALALVLHADARSRLARFAVAGTIAGLAIGLKLTNAPYGLALVIATSITVRPGAPRLPRATALTLGLAIGIAITYGWWAATMASHFANPFFPQFNALFGAPLAAATGIVDSKWFASGPIEALSFPFVFTLFPMRVHEIPLANPLWPMVYVLVIAWVLVATMRPRPHRARDPAGSVVVLFAAIAYVAWLLVFSIGRYLIVLELLFPLLTWTLLHRLLPPRAATAVASLAFVVAAALPFLRFETWGNAPFADAGEPAYRVDVPAIADPAHATVLVLTAPVAWTLTAFPREVAFVGRNGNFPESAAYRAAVRDTIAERGGPVYALLPAETSEAASGLSRMNAFFMARGSRRDDPSCRYARAALANAPASDVVFDDASVDVCRFMRDVGRNRLSSRDAETIAGEIAKEGFLVDLEHCPTFRAWIGASPFDYRFCTVTRR